MSDVSLFTNFTNSELISMYGQLLKELRSRGIIRTKNVTGDLGERIVIEHYNRTPGFPKLQLAPPSTAHIDAISVNGKRYSIKSTSGNGTGVFYGLPPQGSAEEPEQQFEYVVIVKFDVDHNLERIIELSWQQFLQYKRWHSRMKAWSLPLTREVISNARAVYPQQKQHDISGNI